MISYSRSRKTVVELCQRKTCSRILVCKVVVCFSVLGHFVSSTMQEETSGRHGQSIYWGLCRGCRRNIFSHLAYCRYVSPTNNCKTINCTFWCLHQCRSYLNRHVVSGNRHCNTTGFWLKEMVGNLLNLYFLLLVFNDHLTSKTIY